MRRSHSAALKVRTAILPAFVEALRRGGGGDVLDHYGIAADVDPADFGMPLSAFRGLCDAAAARLRDPLLGFHLATSLPRGRYGLLEFVFRSAGTCREAVRELVRYAPLVNSLLVIRLTEEDEHGIVEERVSGEPLCLGRHANEFAMTNVVRIGRDLVGKEFAVERLWLAHPAAGVGADELARYFGTPRIEWGAGYNAVQVPRAVLDLRVRTADSALYAYLEREARERVSRLSAADTFEDVRQAIVRQMATGEPSIDGVAALLGTSGRTLQRRLADGKTTFRSLTDQVRQSAAELYLEGSKRPLTEVAFLLGYSDLRAFVRAYRRWTGRTPGAARRGGGGAPRS